MPAIGALVVACGHESSETYEATQGTVIRSATVVNTRDGSLASDQAIVIDGGKIVKIASNGSVHTSGTAQTVDGTGKYVVPGFLDMHAHAMVHVDEKPSYFPLMLANGITGFREMGAFPGQFPDMVKRVRQLNADIAAGRIDAPEALLAPSDIYSGTTSAATATQNVDQQKALGVDFIKVIGANRDAMLAFLSESKRQDLPLAGHLTPAVSATESSQAGWKSIEHLGSGIGILLDCANDEAALRAAIVSTAGNAAPAFPSDAASLERILNTYSNEKCTNLAKVFVQNGTWNVPTLRRVHALDASDDPAFASDPNLTYVDKTRAAAWAQIEQTFAKQPEQQRVDLRQLFVLQQAVTKLLSDAGVKLMAGSDSGVASIWVVPGFSLHDEFHELAAAGLTPLKVLQMTTLNGAEFLGRQSTMGTVETGKNADLVLLDANPIVDVTNLDRISGVFVKGRYFPKGALDKLKADTATGYGNAPAPVAAEVAKAIEGE